MIDSTAVVETPCLAHADKDTKVSGDGECSRIEEIDPVCLWWRFSCCQTELVAVRS